ncbi:MAG: hypothetical protein R3E39_32145 [Anaerolineae bacterium]
MAQSEMEKLALDLANKVLKTNDRNYVKAWPINNAPDEEVVVIVYRARKTRSVRIREAVKSFEVVAGPSGAKCPLCNGTGKLIT